MLVAWTAASCRHRVGSAEPAICAKRGRSLAGPYRYRTSNDCGVPVLPALPSGGAEHVSIGSEEIGHGGLSKAVVMQLRVTDRVVLAFMSQR